MIAVQQGSAPLIVSMPHAGTMIPEPHRAALRDPDAALADTDWHIDRLYGFAAELGATLVSTAVSRIVIDVNRDPSGKSLYPAMATTELCPTTAFTGEPLYPAGGEPDADTIAARRRDYFDPYHAALAAEIARLRALHPAIVVYDAHSILGRVPRLFEGTLPQFNIGTNSGAACAPELARRVSARCGVDQVVDGRFKGGWITRHYGSPETGVHAIQMELAIRGYAGEADPARWDAARAEPMQHMLRAILQTCIDFTKEPA